MLIVVKQKITAPTFRRTTKFIVNYSSFQENSRLIEDVFDIEKEKTYKQNERKLRDRIKQLEHRLERVQSTTQVSNSVFPLPVTYCCFPPIS